ncbi:MAG: His/Gly/Thr/Pro-type tRNA ligase C-terminal domain-containing protein [Comamonadaceae bacterium]|nr:His/Gly/Thr/Pro-type tRNA ligase C-terminal domain-containing protein [Comamonadaceae bacterium]
MFADAELIGIPHRVVIGERGLKDGEVEYQGRARRRRRHACQLRRSALAFVRKAARQVLGR